MTDDATTESRDLRERIRRLYLQLTDTSDPRGALKWFARRAGVSSSTLNRWIRGVHDPHPSAIALLVELENVAAQLDGPVFDPFEPGEPEKRERNRRIVALVEQGATYDEIGRRFGISKQRVSQIYRRAVDRGDAGGDR